MRMNSNIWPVLLLILGFYLLLGSCLSDGYYNVHTAQGTHLKFTNMGRHIVELNMTDNNEYNISDVKTDSGNIKTGPPDRFMYSNNTAYRCDTTDKKSGEKKLSLLVDHFDEHIMNINYNLLTLGLSDWSADASVPIKSTHLDNYDWVITAGEDENEIDAACFIDSTTILALKMYNINQSDSLAILDSVTSRSV